jgi:tRNA(adenine34) deaminase
VSPRNTYKILRLTEATAKDYEWLEQAIAMAKQSGQDVPVGCLIVKDGVVLAATHNLREANNDPLGHAELLAIKEASTLLKTWRLNDCTLYCTLEPCPMCTEAILQSRISRIVVGAIDPLNGACCSAFNLLSKRHGLPEPELTVGVHGDQCRQLLTDFFKRT